MLERLFAALREQEAVGEDADCFGLDCASAEVHPDGTVARKMNGPQCIGKSRGGWHAKIRMASASDRQTMIFRLSGRNAHDGPEGRALLESWDDPAANAPLAMDRTCEGDETRRLIEETGMTPVVPPKANGTATGRPASFGTRSSGCSEDSRAAGESSRGSTSSTRRFRAS